MLYDRVAMTFDKKPQRYGTQVNCVDGRWQPTDLEAPDAVNARRCKSCFIANLNRMGRRLAADGPFDDEFDIPFTTVHTGTRANSLARSAKGVSVALTTPAGELTVKAEKALVVFGRRPNTDTLGLEKAASEAAA